MLVVIFLFQDERFPFWKQLMLDLAKMIDVNGWVAPSSPLKQRVTR